MLVLLRAECCRASLLHHDKDWCVRPISVAERGVQFKLHLFIINRTSYLLSSVGVRGEEALELSLLFPHQNGQDVEPPENFDREKKGSILTMKIAINNFFMGHLDTPVRYICRCKLLFLAGEVVGR